jgi:hypothetical protein
VPERPLYPVNRTHLDAITGPLGIWQHAVGPVPEPRFGTCTDDVARVLLVDLAHARELGWEAVRESARRSLGFLDEAFDPSAWRFRNFRGADGGWSRDEPSPDSQGRAMLALGSAVGQRPDPDFGLLARAQFEASLVVTGGLHDLRAVASSALGCAAAIDGLVLDDSLRGRTEGALAGLADRLRIAFVKAGDRGPGWPWPEPVLTYENALLPRALIVAGRRLGDARLERTGLTVLDWLIEVQATDGGVFSPIGNEGWWPMGGPRSRFDQQPIEATAMILASEAASTVSAEPRYLAAAERAYAWFLGDNDTGVRVAVPATGGCHDGLEPDGVNLNQGAESTLMWLMALEAMRDLRRRSTVRPATTRSSVLPRGVLRPGELALSASQE